MYLCEIPEKRSITLKFLLVLDLFWALCANTCEI